MPARRPVRRTAGLLELAVKLGANGLGNAERAQQRLELALIHPPAADRALVDRLTHLRRARRSHRPFGFMK